MWLTVTEAASPPTWNFPWCIQPADDGLRWDGIRWSQAAVVFPPLSSLSVSPVSILGSLCRCWSAESDSAWWRRRRRTDVPLTTCWTLTARARRQNQVEAFYPAMVCQNSGPVYNLMLFSRLRSMWTELNPHSCFASRIFSDFMGTSSDENLVMLHRNSNYVMVFV